MPIIRSSRFIQMVAAYGTWRFGLQSLVWCGAVDYVSRLRDGAAYGTWRFGFTGRWSGVELWLGVRVAECCSE